jgi:hypothetical protein
MSIFSFVPSSQKDRTRLAAQRGGSGARPKRERSEREGRVARNRVLGRAIPSLSKTSLRGGQIAPKPGVSTHRHPILDRVDYSSDKLVLYHC